jgi:phosphatidate cytidylyltransferase
MFQRVFVAIDLTLLVLFSLYYQWIGFLHWLMILATIYDLSSVMIQVRFPSRVQYTLILLLFTIMSVFNDHVLQQYYQNPCRVIQIAIISQVSDVLQYVIGCRGQFFIGWISPKKTIEGYVGGGMAVIAVLRYGLPLFHSYVSLNCLLIPVKFILQVYLLGTISGLISSLCKRLLGIKDYSALLGPHGGWLDRIDSMVLPTFLLSCL